MEWIIGIGPVSVVEERGRKAKGKGKREKGGGEGEDCPTLVRGYRQCTDYSARYSILYREKQCVCRIVPRTCVALNLAIIGSGVALILPLRCDAPDNVFVPTLAADL
jgi:hypothetical protein